MTMESERNPVADAADIASKLAPLLFGKTGSSSSSGTVDPEVLAMSNNLLKLLQQKGTDKAAADGVIEDILYRAQLAFTPVLGEEKTAGVYNTTTKNLLAKDAINRATAASAEAVWKMQQASLDAAAQLAGSELKATSGTKAQTKENPGVALGSLIKMAGVGVGVGEAVKYAKNLFGETAKKAGKKAAAGTDTADSEYFKGVEDYFNSGQQAIDEAGVDMASFGPIGGSGEAGSFTSTSAGAEALGAPGPSITAGEDAILMNILDTTTAPLAAAGVQVADAGAAAGTATDVVAPLLAAGGISADSALTIGPIGVQKAAEANAEALTGGAEVLEAPAAAGETAAATEGTVAAAGAEGAGAAGGLASAGAALAVIAAPHVGKAIGDAVFGEQSAFDVQHIYRSLGLDEHGNPLPAANHAMVSTPFGSYFDPLQYAVPSIDPANFTDETPAVETPTDNITGGSGRSIARD